MNFKAEIDFDGFEADYINVDRMAKTVKFVPKEYMGGTSVSYGELLTGLCENGVNPEDIQGIYKVSARDSSYSVLFKYDDAMRKIHAKTSIVINKIPFDIMRMDEQIVNLKVHWLPLYMDNSLLWEIFSEYGKVVDVSMQKTSHALVSAFNGIREVRLKTDEFRKQRIPHLVNFNSGQSILITMAGRSPYCLECRSVGHIRSRCPTNKKFNQLFTGNQRMEVAVAPAPPDAPAPQVDVTSGSDTSAPDVTPAPANVGTEVEVAVGLGQEEQQEESMEGSESNGAKRGRDHEPGDDDGFVKPTKTAKAQSWADEPEPVSLQNNFLDLAPGIYSPSDQVPPSQVD